jgi:hemoglobin
VHLYGNKNFFEKIGGLKTIHRVVDIFYDLVEKDPDLRPLFPKSLHHGRQMQKLFLEEWLGGRPLYSSRGREKGAIQGGMHGIHYRFVIPVKAAGRWLHHMASALKEAGVLEKDRAGIMEVLAPIAHEMVNDGADFPQLLKALRLAGNGDIDEIRKIIEEKPEIVTQRGTAGRTLLWESARNGHIAVTKLLIQNGANPNVPGGAPFLLTPYALAVSRGHNNIGSYLIDHGNIMDIFTTCFLGNIDYLTKTLAQDISAIDSFQTFEDINPVVPLHYAVYGGHFEITQILLSSGANVKPYISELTSLARSMDRKDIISLLKTR